MGEVDSEPQTNRFALSHSPEWSGAPSFARGRENFRDSLMGCHSRDSPWSAIFSQQTLQLRCPCRPCMSGCQVPQRQVLPAPHPRRRLPGPEGGLGGIHHCVWGRGGGLCSHLAGRAGGGGGGERGRWRLVWRNVNLPGDPETSGKSA